MSDMPERLKMMAVEWQGKPGDVVWRAQDPVDGTEYIRADLVASTLSHSAPSWKANDTTSASNPPLETQDLRALYAESNAEYDFAFNEGKASVGRDTGAIVAAIERAARTVAAAILHAPRAPIGMRLLDACEFANQLWRDVEK